MKKFIYDRQHGVYYYGSFRTHKFGGFWKVFDDSKPFQNRFQFMCDTLREAKMWILAQDKGPISEAPV